MGLSMSKEGRPQKSYQKWQCQFQFGSKMRKVGNGMKLAEVEVTCMEDKGKTLSPPFQPSPRCISWSTPDFNKRIAAQTTANEHNEIATPCDQSPSPLPTAFPVFAARKRLLLNFMANTQQYNIVFSKILSQ